MLRVCCCVLLLLVSSVSFSQSLPSPAEIRAVQLALKERGYDPGPVDGDFGRRTAKAMRSFEQASGLTGVGNASLTVKQRLIGVFPDIVAPYRKAAELTPAEIRAVQSALKKRGHDPGPVDGSYGMSTAEAIRGFEQASGLPVAGAISLDIQKRLNAIVPDTVVRYREIARLGEVWAQFNVGEMYEKGLGVPRDGAEAVAWHRKAAAQGNVWSQYSLGEIYDKGLGVRRDRIEAHMWFQLAAAQGHEKAHQRRDIIARAMTPGQIEEAERMTREWLAQNQQ
jgi:peptidoglycan hydrolase-like protein with peptidoglycan-binding domain